MKKNDILNYPRKLIVRIAFIIILLSTLQETIRHYQIESNFKAIRQLAYQYDGLEEEQKIRQEEIKRIKASDALNVTILIIKLSFLIGVLYTYDRKYFNNKK